jgi:hypothetical protein
MSKTRIVLIVEISIGQRQTLCDEGRASRGCCVMMTVV